MHMATNVVQVRGLVRHHPKHGPRDAGQLGRTCGAKGPGEEIAADGRSRSRPSPRRLWTRVDPRGNERSRKSTGFAWPCVRSLAS
jgi:hypothetical protein